MINLLSYTIGNFNGTAFVANSNTAPPSPTSTSVSTPTSTGSQASITYSCQTATATGDVTLQDFEATVDFIDFASRGWVATGGLVGAAPAQGTLSRQQTVSGYAGTRLVNTFLHGGSTTDTLSSPPFTITRLLINFLIGGGNAPGVECINLLLGNQVVRTMYGGMAATRTGQCTSPARDVRAGNSGLCICDDGGTAAGAVNGHASATFLD